MWMAYYEQWHDIHQSLLSELEPKNRMLKKKKLQAIVSAAVSRAANLISAEIRWILLAAGAEECLERQNSQFRERLDTSRMPPTDAL